MSGFTVTVTRPGTGERFTRTCAGAVVLGRLPDCDIHLPDPQVSRQHAEISATDDGAVVVRDLNSTNGCVVQGSLLKDAAVSVANEAMVQIGPYVIAVRAENAAGEDTVISRLAEDRTLAGSAAGAGATWETAPDGTVTLLFSDIEGSTALNVELGDRRWMQLLREHQAIVRREIGARGGYEVKTEGDGFMLAFRSARDALHCAIAMQRAFAQRNDSLDEDGTPINVRVGLHTGEPVAQGDDFYGVHVVMAARIADQASGGEVLVSTLLRELVEVSGEFEFQPRDPVALKGLSGSHTLHTVVWNESEGRRATPRARHG